MFSDIMCEFGVWEKFWPVSLFVVTEGAKVLLKFLVNPFGFSVCLWVVGGG